MNIPRKKQIGSIEIIDSTWPEFEDPKGKFWHDMYRIPEVLIKISGKTKREDIINAWPEIKRAQKRLADFERKKKERNKTYNRIIELLREGIKNPGKIQRLLLEEGLKDVSESYIRNVKSDYDIAVKEREMSNLDNDILHVIEI